MIKFTTTEAAAAAKADRERGVHLASSGLDGEAISAFRDAVRRMPGDFESWCNLGVLLRRRGEAAEAETAYRRALAIKPNWDTCLYNLANLLNDSGRAEEALDFYVRAVTVNPEYAEAFNNFARCLIGQGKAEEAFFVCRQAVDLDPLSPMPHMNMGQCLNEQGRFGEAVDAFSRALSLQPDNFDAKRGLAFSLAQLKRLDEAIDLFVEVLQQCPDAGAEERLNIGLLCLQAGRFAEGWDFYEGRLDLAKYEQFRASFSSSPWDGSPLEGKEILLCCEQGRGDAIQFIRYAPLVAQRGGKVSVACYPELASLFSRIDGVTAIEPRKNQGAKDRLYVSVMSLPRLFKTRPETIPNTVPYLVPSAEKISKWQERLGEGTAIRKIGIVWRGTAANGIDRYRSIPPLLLAPLLGVEGVTFFSFQKELSATDAKIVQAFPTLKHIGHLFEDFDDTAAAIQCMDLIISVDTAVAHLAGAMAAPVWVLVSLAGDWRWGMEQEDCPWYPSARIFRQSPDGDWSETIEAMAQELVKSEVRP